MRSSRAILLAAAGFPKFDFLEDAERIRKALRRQAAEIGVEIQKKQLQLFNSELKLPPILSDN